VSTIKRIVRRFFVFSREIVDLALRRSRKNAIG